MLQKADSGVDAKVSVEPGRPKRKVHLSEHT